MRIVVSYDIVQDRCRAKVARCMEDYGTRVQKSVFECSLDEGSLVRLQVKLSDLIDQEQDSVRFYRLCNRCRSTIEVLGAGSILDDETIVII